MPEQAAEAEPEVEAEQAEEPEPEQAKELEPEELKAEQALTPELTGSEETAELKPANQAEELYGEELGPEELVPEEAEELNGEEQAERLYRHGHPRCTMTDECDGDPFDTLVRHYIKHQDDGGTVTFEPGDIYCATCWRQFSLRRDTVALVEPAAN